jgi:hypothetical protein
MRPRGFIDDYNPRAKTRELFAQVKDVLATYEAELPLTARQVFYRLVATVDYEKTENAYLRLQEHLVNFRRAGVIGFEVIRDDGGIVEAPLEWSSPEHFLEVAERLARESQGVRLEGQPNWVEVWCEAAGMAPQLARAVGEYGVTIYSSGGFDSVTLKYEAAVRIAGRDVPTVVIHIGDLDRSGLSLVQAAAEDVEAFVLGLTSANGSLGGVFTALLGEGDPMVRFERAALTVEQAERLALPTAPPKATDRRFAWTEDGILDVRAEAAWVEENGTVQAEALPPDVLAQEVRQAVIAELDMDAFGEAQETEAANREAIEDILRRLRGEDEDGASDGE